MVGARKIELLEKTIKSPLVRNKSFGNCQGNRIAGLFYKIKAFLQHVFTYFLGHYCAGYGPAILPCVAAAVGTAAQKFHNAYMPVDLGFNRFRFYLNGNYDISVFKQNVYFSVRNRIATIFN